jgi:DNA-binding SARP family transcriptional activator
MLYCLAVHLRPVPREQLCFLFWSDVPESNARRNLTRLLSHLRRALPVPALLVASGDYVGLEPDRIWSDAAAFECLCGTSNGQERIEALQQAKLTASDSLTAI